MSPRTCIYGLALVGALELQGCGPAFSETRAAEHSGAEPASVVITDDGAFDAGSIDVTDTIDHTFVLTNTGSRVVELGYVWKACNCTELELDKKSLAPGESAAARALVRFNSEDYGPRTIQAAIYESKESSVPLVRITLFARVGKPAVLTFSPALLDLGLVEGSGAQEARVNLDVIDLVASEGCVPELTGFDDAEAFEAVLSTTPQRSVVGGHSRRSFEVVVRTKPGFRGDRQATLGARMAVGEVELADRLAVKAAERPWLQFARSEIFAGRIASGSRHKFELLALTVDPACRVGLECVPSADWIEARWTTDVERPTLAVTLTPQTPGRLDEQVMLRCGALELPIALRGWVD